MSQRFVRFLLSFVIALTLTQSFNSAIQAEKPSEARLEARLIERAARTLNRPAAQLRIADLETLTLPRSGKKISLAKVEDA